ncbi:ROK family protein [Egicoccus sp. AB-alg2]|uniref:ROK family protein n=1 Tax=Egicoccus sp. AB-alg2 TaxID=3242693 RepID=UPI00359ECC9D
MHEHGTGAVGPRPVSGRGARASGLRRANLSAVLRHVHLHGGTSRSELTAAIGLNRSTIGALVAELVDLGLVTEVGGTASSGPGRPSPVVHPRAEGAHVLAIELAADAATVATVGIGGHVVSTATVPHDPQKHAPEDLVADLATAAGPLLETLSGGTLTAVGVAVVGVTRRSDGFVHLAPNLGWRDVPLAASLRAALRPRLPGPVPVHVANEADLGALAEHRRGAGRGVDHLVFVSGEIGIGVGVISDGVPLLGAAGYAGEAGHMLIDPQGRRCGCGARGCWETAAGQTALLREAGMDPHAPGAVAVPELLARAEAGDEAALGAAEAVGRWLGIGVGNLVNLLNPSLVVLSGLYRQTFPLIERSVREGLATRVLDPPGELVRIVPSALGGSAPLVGAAELAFAELLSDPGLHVG